MNKEDRKAELIDLGNRLSDYLPYVTFTDKELRSIQHKRGVDYHKAKKDFIMNRRASIVVEMTRILDEIIEIDQPTDKTIKIESQWK